MMRCTRSYIIHSFTTFLVGVLVFFSILVYLCNHFACVCFPFGFILVSSLFCVYFLVTLFYIYFLVHMAGLNCCFNQINNNEHVFIAHAHAPICYNNNNNGDEEDGEKTTPLTYFFILIIILLNVIITLSFGREKKL